MKRTIAHLSDDDLHGALVHEPSFGLAQIVADDIARDVALSPQDRRAFRWPWSPAEPTIGPSPRAMWATVVIGLALGLTVLIIAVGAFLHRPAPLMNGSIAFAAPEGGVTLLDADGRIEGSWPGAPAAFLSWSPDGTRLAFWSDVNGVADKIDKTGYAWELALIDLRSGTLTTPMNLGAPATLEPNGPIQWSNDGHRIIADVIADGSPAVLIADLTSGSFSRIGPADTDVMVAAWSADGGRLAYIAQPRFSLDWRLYLADADGDHPVEQSLAFPAGVALLDAGGRVGMVQQEGYPISWSPDSTMLLITGTSGSGATSLLVERISDGSLSALTPASVSPVLSKWSPDGSSIAFLSGDDVRQVNDLYVMNADGSSLRPVFGGCGPIDWAPDRSKVFGGCGSIDWAPDGSRLLFATGGDLSNDWAMEVRTIRTDGTGMRTIWSGPGKTSYFLPDQSLSWQGIRP